MAKENRAIDFTTVTTGFADSMCDVVEHATALQASITEMRWRMLRGEFNPMQAALWRTKTNLKELTRSLGLLEHYIKDDFDKGETQ